MPRVPIALVGCGRWGRHILRDLRALGCEVIVADGQPSAREHARAAGAAHVVHAFADAPRVAGVVIATPAIDHAASVAEALDRGVPVFCEKPLAATAEVAAQLAELGGARLFVMDKWRYHPGIEALRDVARSGELGAVIGLHTTRIGRSAPQADVDAVWTLAPHDLSIALEILGAIPEPRAAVAECLDGRPTGLVALLGDQPWMVMDVAVDTRDVRREIRLTCERAVALLPHAYSDHVLVAHDLEGRDTTSAEKRPISTELPLLRELRAFLDHLAGGPPPKSTAADGARVLATLTRLRQLAGIDASRPADDHGRPDTSG
jgi:predicted dehydrogenase